MINGLPGLVLLVRNMVRTHCCTLTSTALPKETNCQYNSRAHNAQEYESVQKSFWWAELDLIHSKVGGVDGDIFQGRVEGSRVDSGTGSSHTSASLLVPRQVVSTATVLQV